VHQVGDEDVIIPDGGITQTVTDTFKYPAEGLGAGPGTVTETKGGIIDPCQQGSFEVTIR